MFSDSQMLEISTYGLNIESVEKQIERFKTGFPTIHITQTATKDNGILHFDEKKL